MNRFFFREYTMKKKTPFSINILKVEEFFYIFLYHIRKYKWFVCTLFALMICYHHVFIKFYPKMNIYYLIHPAHVFRSLMLCCHFFVHKASKASNIRQQIDNVSRRLYCAIIRELHNYIH